MEYHGVAMGGKIYSLRAAKGMTQEQLAVELCISPAAVSKWERNLDNATLTAALRGASGSVVIRFLANLSDRVLIFVCEDIERWEGTEKEIVDAQKRVLELSRKVMPGEGVKESKK